MKKMAILIMAVLIGVTAFANDYFIYGKITTIDDDEFTGQLRWEGEECFLFDHFNGSKDDNPNMKYLSDEDMKNFTMYDDGFPGKVERFINETFDVNVSLNTHVFRVEFGNVKEIYIKDENSCDVTLNNGEIIELEGGSNDMGADVTVYDPKVGETTIKWDRIHKVELMKFPEDMESEIGMPLYGTVELSDKKFTGFIQWDRDERVTTDKLDGDHNDGNISMKFGNIQAIEKRGDGCMVFSKDSERMLLTGTNDVDNGNRGIIVTIPNKMTIEIDWKEVRRVEFTEIPEDIVKFEDYATIKELSASVMADGEENYEGRIVFDLDEEYDCEMLDGEIDGVNYQIPLRNVKSLKKKNVSFTTVKLANDDALLLGEAHDVTDANEGSLIFKGDEDPKYLPWGKIHSITFK